MFTLFNYSLISRFMAKFSFILRVFLSPSTFLQDGGFFMAY